MYRVIINILFLLIISISCEEPVIEGCTTVTACNYNAEAGKDDGSCLENDCAGECGGDTVLDCAGDCGGDAKEDDCGICDGKMQI